MLSHTIVYLLIGCAVEAVTWSIRRSVEGKHHRPQLSGVLLWPLVVLAFLCALVAHLTARNR